MQDTVLGEMVHPRRDLWIRSISAGMPRCLENKRGSLADVDVNERLSRISGVTVANLVD